jgi:hypothetical protein
MGACFVAVGSAHLAFIAVVAPEDLPLWGAVYTSTFSRSAPPGLAQPWWYYAAVVYRDLCVFAPALALAPLSLIKPVGAHRASLLAILGSAAATLVLLSASEVKESLYAYVLTPALLLFVALGLRQLATMGAGSPAAWYRVARWAVAAGSCLLAALVLGAWESGSSPAALDGYFAFGHAVVMVGGALSVLAFGPGTRRQSRLALALCCLGAVWGGVEVAKRLAEQNQAALPAIAAHFADLSTARPPGQGSAECAFASSYAVPLSYYTWQRGCSWVELVESAGAIEPARVTARLRWFQLDAEYAPRLGAPSSPKFHHELLRYLAEHTTEVSAMIAPTLARHTRVFARTPVEDRASR